MKHAGATALATLAPLLGDVRRVACTVWVERKPGTFYRRGAACLHFHEDPAGLFADLKVEGAWQRFAVDGAAQRAALLRAIERLLGS